MRKPRQFSIKPIHDVRRPLGATLQGAFDPSWKQRKGRGTSVSVLLLLSMVLILAALILLLVFSQ